MNLLFLRHAIAIDREDPECPPDDFDRALTKEGRKKMAEGARGMCALGVSFDRIFSSPLVRALQTAEIVAAEYPKPPKIEKADALAPGMEADSLVEFLRRHGAFGQTVLLTGHEPDFGRAVAQLAFGVDAPEFSIKKGGLACVEIVSTGRPARGTLLWLLTPKLLRAAAGVAE